LLSRDVKRSPRALGWPAGLILVMQLVYLYYQVLPAFPATSLADYWMSLIAPLGVGGLWLANFLGNLKAAPLLAPHDANREAALHYERLDREEAGREREVQRG